MKQWADSRLSVVFCPKVERMEYPMVILQTAPDEIRPDIEPADPRRSRVPAGLPADHPRGGTPLGDHHPRAALMAAFIFDASGIVKRYVTEIGSGFVQGLTDPAAAHDVFLTRLTRAEIVAAITRRRIGWRQKKSLP